MGRVGGVGIVGRRLFLAVDIDEHVRGAIGRISSDLQQRIGPHMRATWVKPHRMHLTLHFFGEVDAATEERLRAALVDPIAQEPFDLSFDRIGCFPEKGAPRVLWLGIRDGASELKRTQQILAVRLSVTDPAFKPHLTLARIRDRVRRGQIGEITSIPASAGPCRIDRVTLYESRLSPAGPTYLRLASASLTP